MSAIHYFQRYSQPENVATNNTLLLFSRLYHHSPSVYAAFMQALLEDIDLNFGVKIIQQQKSLYTVPDGVVSQESIKLIIESKLDTRQLNIDQLVGHLGAFNAEDNQVIISLTPEMPSLKIQSQIEEAVAESNATNRTSIVYVALTFEKIIVCLRQAIQPFDQMMQDVADDYEDFCIQSNLVPVHHNIMRAVPCAKSMVFNKKYSVYVDKAGRSYRAHTFIGLYKSKTVQYLGRLLNTIEANCIDGVVQVLASTSVPTSQQLDNIQGIVLEMLDAGVYNLQHDQVFFCVDSFEATNFVKSSPGGMQSKRFLDLGPYFSPSSVPGSTTDVANGLKGQLWQ